MADIPDSEKNALIDLYKSTNGQDWSDSKNWLSNTTSPCDWYGIQCDATNSHVDQLLLQGNGLTGSLPDSVGNLTELTVWSMDIPPNNIGGTIPASIGNLAQMFVFTMASQSLEGTIPSEFGQLKSLSILHLGGNHLTSIPDSISNLGPFSSFAIEDNEMTSKLPDNGPSFQSGSIGVCDLSGNDFECPIPTWARDALCEASCK